MKCPFCSSDSNKVLDKRETGDNEVIRRRRECIKCKKRFTTYERFEAVNIIVVKKDGNREQFDRKKLEMGMVKSCEKRPIPFEKIQKALDSIEAELIKKGKREIKSTIIGNMVMRRLKKLDKVAYIRFASIYQEFTDLKTFQQELKKLIQMQK